MIFNCLSFYAFASNAKHFAIAFPFLLFLFLVRAFGRTGKSCFQFFVQLLWVRVTRIGVNKMICWEHLKFSSSTTKSIISALPQCLWSPNLAGYWLIMRGSHPQKSHDSLITWSCKIKWQTKFVITPLSQCLWPQNLVGRRVILKGS